MLLQCSPLLEVEPLLGLQLDLSLQDMKLCELGWQVVNMELFKVLLLR